MRLISTTVRHYRVHHELRVEFDETCTLIGGPNECGKSTLIEAIHRALFLKSKVTGDVQRSMVSTSSLGAPEVEVSFEVGGQTYHITKRFSGSSGTSLLVEEGGSTWMGDEAESRIASLLGVDAIGGGRGVGDRVSQQWAHLWIWQGQSGDDPTEHASAQHSNLLQRLQESGGAAAMQSALDTSVAASFANATEETFVRERAKAGSDLDKAENAAVEAEERHRLASERLERLQQAVGDFESATSTLAQTEQDAQRIVGQLSVTSSKQTQVEELRRQEAQQLSTSEAAAEKYASLERAQDQIVKLREAAAKIDGALAPHAAEVSRLAEAREEIKRRADLAIVEYEAACDATRRCRQRHELAVACVSRFEKAARFEELSKKAAQAKRLDATLTGLKQELAKLPEIDGAKLKKIQKAENEVSSADAALKAMAASLDVIASNRPVIVAGSSQPVGTSRVLLEDTEILIGNTIRLRVRPGGGTSLTDARQKAHDTRQALQKLLDASSVTSAAEAAEIVARRADIGTRIEAAESTVESLDAANIAADVSEAKTASTSAEAEVARRSEQCPEFSCPVSAKEANQALGENTQELRNAEGEERRRKATRDAEAKTLAEADSSLQHARQETEKQTRTIGDLRAQLRLLLETHGDDETRSILLTQARSARTSADALLSSTRQAIADLQPDLLTADLSRYKRAQAQLEKNRAEAETKRAVAQAALRFDGTDDPEAALALALSQLESCHAHLQAVRRKAEAVRLVHQLFLDEQRILSERFTQPLAEKVSEYLRCLFGAGARATVSLAENSFSGLQLIRPSNGSSAISFETLSGGTKEQVAAAMRLAMAEILAADYDNRLPVVFDDAFAYSDPERVQTLQRMLDLAAAHGLQLIIITCNPSDYSALGARSVEMKVQRVPITPSTNDFHVDAATDISADDHSILTVSSAVVTEELRQQLLAQLRAGGGKAGNLTLRQTLDWDEATYDAVKENLVSSGLLAQGRGRGGSVSLITQ